jgi:hypothetical protein
MGAFSPRRHPSRPPEVAKLLEILHRLDVRYILAGSVAAAAHGVEAEPGDLDIVPDLHAANLDRLILVLRDVEAAPHGPFGSWNRTEGGRWKWTARPTTPEELAEWRPHVRDVASFDHLFVTRLGNFDVMPRIAGTYETLRPRAVLRHRHGCDLHVACVDDLLAALTVADREKDRRRVAALLEIQTNRRA